MVAMTAGHAGASGAHAAPEAPGAPEGATLGAVVDALGPGVLRVLVAPRGLDVTIGEPVVHDPVGEPQASRHDVVLAVGVEAHRRSAVDVVTRYGELGATAVLLRADGPLPAALLTAADNAGVALLAAPQDAAWGQLVGLVRGARSASLQRRSAGAAGPLGDLFALADAVASLVGGATTVEDEHHVVLAYSTAVDLPVDAARRATILGRRVPTEWITRLHELGVFRRLWSSDAVQRIDLEDAEPRLAVAVRAGGELLGSLWVVQGDKPFGPDAEGALAEAAQLAALHLLRARSDEDLERRRAGEQLRSVLDGRLPATVLAEELGLRADDPVLLLGLETTGGDAQPGAVPALERAVDLLVLSCRAFRRPVVAGTLGRTAYAVLAARSTGEDGAAEARQVATQLGTRLGSGLREEVRVVTVDVPDGLVGLVASRHEADLALRVLRQRGGGGSPQHVHVEEVRAGAVLLQLRDLAAGRPGLTAGRARLLHASDRERATSYVPTLRAFLDAFGDVRVAADRVGVHPNTFRYRLRRLAELAHLDLDDPVERLVVQLQLHLLDA